MKKILENTSIVFSLTIIIAIIYPDLAKPLGALITPVLIIAMTLSLREVKFDLKDLKSSRNQVFISVFMNYFILTAFTLAIGFAFIDDLEYLKGFIVMAAVPPAIAVVAFAYLLGGNTKVAVLGEILCYILSLFLTPLIILLLLGGSVDLGYLIGLLVVLILFPLLLSRLIRGYKSRLFEYDKVMINICYMVVTYIVVGLNQKDLVTNYIGLLPIFLTLFARTFVIGTIIFVFLKWFKIGFKERITYSLFGSYKNGGATAVIAMMLFGVKAALPAAIQSIFELTYIIYFKRLIQFFNEE